MSRQSLSTSQCTVTGSINEELSKIYRIIRSNIEHKFYRVKVARQHHPYRKIKRFNCLLVSPCGVNRFTAMTVIFSTTPLIHVGTLDALTAELARRLGIAPPLAF